MNKHCPHCGGEIVIEFVNPPVQAVKDLNGQFIHPAIIIDTVLKYYEYELRLIGYSTFAGVIEKNRTRPLPYVRQLIMVLLKKKTNLTLGRIGEMFNGRDHTTVIHALDKIDDLMFSDPKVLEDIRNINNLLNKKNEC